MFYYIKDSYIFKSIDIFDFFKCLDFILLHSVHLGVNSPSKTSPPYFLRSVPLNLQTVQAPLFRQFPLYIKFSYLTCSPSESQIFQWNPKIF